MTVDSLGPSRLTVAKSQNEGQVRVVATGEVDLSTVERLRATITAAVEPGPSEVVVDLRAVTFLDSTGVGALIDARKQAMTYGSRIRVINPQPVVRRVLEVTGVLGVLSAGES